jgi:2-keto-3-deoxy-L-rhamnonate aldolase RhmA
MATDASWSKQYQKLGFNMLAAGTDQAILVSGWKSILSPLGERTR